MTIATDENHVAELAIALLAAAVPDAAVEAYHGQAEDAITGKLTRFPLLTVVFTGLTFEPIDGPGQREASEYEVGMYVHSLKGKADLRTKMATLSGSVKTCLVNASLAENVERAKPLRITPAAGSDSVLIHVFNFSVATDRTYQWG